MRDKNFQQALWQSHLPATPSTSQWGGTSGNLVGDGTTPHVKGPWETLLTATFDIYGFWVGVAGTFIITTQTDQMLDIAIGASQENIIVPELLCGWLNVPLAGPRWLYFPIFVPAGSVISGRIQSLILSDTADVLIFANSAASAQPGPLFSGCDAYGTNAAASQGTSHTPGSTGAESTAADIGGTLTKNYGAVLLLPQGSMSNAIADRAYHWEVVLGGTTICEYYSSSSSSEVCYGPFPPVPFYCSLPSASQLQVRAECSGVPVAMDVALYCFY